LRNIATVKLILLSRHCEPLAAKQSNFIKPSLRAACGEAI